MAIDRDDPFLTRDWDAVAEAKEARWVSQLQRHGTAEGTRIGEALWVHAKATRPDWPSAESRALDLAHHERLARLLRAVTDH